MAPKQKTGGITVEQDTYLVPDVSIKDLLNAIPYVYSPLLPILDLHPPQHTLLPTLGSQVRSLRVGASFRTANSTYQRLRRLWDLFVIGCIYKTASCLDTLIDPAVISLPHPALYRLASFSVWTLYGFWTGLFATGIWVIGHECGHQAFSESKFVNNTVGWVLHSACVHFWH